MKRQNLIDVWDDRRIEPGDEWGNEIDENLEIADVTMFLVSPDFMASEYCNEIEVRRAMERHEAGETMVVPILVRHVDWGSAPFGMVQGLPEDAVPVKAFEDRDEAWAGVATALRAVVERIAKNRQPLS